MGTDQSSCVHGGSHLYRAQFSSLDKVWLLPHRADTLFPSNETIQFNVLSQIIVSSPFTICLFNLSWGLIISTFPEKASSTSAKQVQKTDEKIILQVWQDGHIMWVMVWGEEWGNRLVIGCWNSTVLITKSLPLKLYVLALLLNKNRPDRINNNGNLNFQNEVKDLETLEFEPSNGHKK